MTESERSIFHRVEIFKFIKSMLLLALFSWISFSCCVLKLKAHDLPNQTQVHVDFLLCFLL